MNPLKIAFVIQSLDWAPNYQDGYSTQIYHILEGLKATGHEVTLVATRELKKVLYSPDLRSDQYYKLTFTNGLFFRWVEGAARRVQHEFRLPWVQIFDSLRLYDAATHYLKGVDLLYERNGMYGIGVALASKRMRTPYVLHVDADYFLEHDYLGIRHTWLERLIARQTYLFNYHAAHAITCVSQVTKEYLVSRYNVPPDRVTVLPNGAPVYVPPPADVVESKKAEMGLDGQPTALFLGGFHHWHGLEMLVEAFQIILEQLPEAKLILVGDGQTRPAVENRVKQLGIADRVLFTGRVSHQDVPMYLALADVAVAPYPKMNSTFWGSPMKVFEYMAAGKAVVASRAGQVGEVIEDGRTGLLVEPGDAGAMAEALLKLFSNPQVRRQIGEQARRTLEQEYTWAKYIQRLEGVYAEAIARAKASSI